MIPTGIYDTHGNLLRKNASCNSVTYCDRSLAETLMPDNLQFDRAEPAPGAAALGAMTCKSCGTLLRDSYFTVNGNIVPAPWSESRRSISLPMSSGRGTNVYQSFHSSPSFTAATRPSR